MTSELKQQWPDLAGRDLGGSVVYANDELFAVRENLIKPGDPVFQPHTFGPKGQIMDGWETRRRRQPGDDHAIVRLGCGGVVRRVVVDTSWFTGNYPPEVSVEACGAEGYPSPGELADADWVTLVPRSPVQGDSRNEFTVTVEQRFTHVRLTIYPDGGVARLRVFGEPVPDPRLLPGVIDLAALENGALVTDSSNSFYNSAGQLIMPGLARVMGDGWETSRRRDQGHDWVAVQLACAGVVEVAELDTSCFVGNAPGWASLTGDGGDLLPRTALQPDTRHRFAIAGGPVAEQVRLDIYPDGGMARLRVYGAPTPAAWESLASRFLSLLPRPQLAAVLEGAGLPAAEAERRAGFDEEPATPGAAVGGATNEGRPAADRARTSVPAAADRARTEDPPTATRRAESHDTEGANAPGSDTPKGANGGARTPPKAPTVGWTLGDLPPSARAAFHLAPR
jgi:allantoicase